MRRQYDDFTQLKLKDMSKTMSEMTYKYINPDTQTPTKVPPAHYEKILNKVTEKYMSEITSRQFLNIMYTQLCNLKKEDEKYFYQALLCMDLGLNPKELKIEDQIAVGYTDNFIFDKIAMEKKDFHFLDSSIIDAYETAKEDSFLQADVISESERIDDLEDRMFSSHSDYER